MLIRGTGVGVGVRSDERGVLVRMMIDMPKDKLRSCRVLIEVELGPVDANEQS